jgi:DNA-binding NarL/FixJ family response regulator
MPINLAMNPGSEAGKAPGRGFQIDDVTQRLVAALDDACDIVDLPAWSPSAPSRLSAEIGEYADVVFGEVITALRGASTRASAADIATLSDLAVVLQRLRCEHHEIVTDARIRRLVASQRGPGVIAGEAGVLGLLARAAEDAVQLCGLDRAMVFRLDGDRLVSVATFFTGHSDWAQDVQKAAERVDFTLVPNRPETTLINQRAPALVINPMNDPDAFQPIVRKVETDSYVAVPISVNGRVAATLHLDAYFGGRSVDAADRDAVAAFALTLGLRLEQEAAIEQLAAHRNALSGMAAEADYAVAALTGGSYSGIPLHTAIHHTTVDLASAIAVPARQRHGSLSVLDDLTRREMEVLELMTTGATNTDIAHRLFISEGTVKTHVKKILRKLGVSNRGQAAAIYHQMAETC